MKNGVESGSCRITELFSPIQRRQILRDKITAVSGEILEITGAKIVDYCQTRVGKFFLQRQREIRSDEPGAACDDEVGRGSGHRQINLRGQGLLSFRAKSRNL